MTIDRRSFLRWSLATGLGLPSIAAARSRSVVRERHLPISPERVIVAADGWQGRNRRLEDSLRASLVGRHDLPAGKLDVIFRLMQAMTGHYQAPHLFLTWATGLAQREALGSTGLGHGFGLLHQFQDASPVRLVNPPVDWWLFLFPEGVEWGAFDERLVFGMIGHVFPAHHAQLPGLKLRTWILASAMGRGMDADSWAWIAESDRITAAKTVNQAILLALQSACQPEGHR